MKTPDETAAELVRQLNSISTRVLTAAKRAAKNEGLTLVDAQRLADLEALAVAVRAAVETAAMTRDYGDVLRQRPDDHYSGKRWLIRRDEGRAVYDAVNRIKRANGPLGCLVE